jgi:hypothetical protein
VLQTIVAIELFGSVAVASLRIMSKKDMSNRSTEYAVMFLGRV